MQFGKPWASLSAPRVRDHFYTISASLVAPRVLVLDTPRDLRGNHMPKSRNADNSVLQRKVKAFLDWFGGDEAAIR